MIEMIALAHTTRACLHKQSQSQAIVIQFLNYLKNFKASLNNRANACSRVTLTRFFVIFPLARVALSSLWIIHSVSHGAFAVEQAAQEMALVFPAVLPGADFISQIRTQIYGQNLNCFLELNFKYAFMMKLF
jgi:hypothetical protein